MGKKVDKISIITVDPYIPRIYKYAKGSFNQLKSIKASKNDFIIGYVANKDLIIETLDIGANIPPEDVADAIENKAYEELKLDPAIEYNITFTRAYGEGGNLYQVFISDKNSLAKLYSPIKKRVSFIDVVAPAPLLFEILYKDTTIPVGNIDLFIIFGEYDTFLTFYKGGKYLYSKSIPYSLDDLYYRFCELAGEAIVKKDEFKKILSTEGLKVDNDRYKELLVKIFNECFLSINDVLIYT
ncbi:MAG: hypothetical protein GXO02_05005, partial [Epsilonproteobacteria bacterium]|nr:hypothetical protein [Campylobacterota bacterium]